MADNDPWTYQNGTDPGQILGDFPILKFWK